MERIIRPSFVVLLSLLLAACGSERVAAGVDDAGALAPEAAAAAASAEAVCRSAPNGPKLTVMTRNLYLGGAIEAVAAATTPEEVFEAATQFWVDVQMTDFPSRAKVIADEVFWARPEVLGLQEVTLYRSGPSAACEGDFTPSADEVELDFLAILQRELRRRGLQYEVAGQVTTMDAELCLLDVLGSGDVKDIRYTDRDVLLVRKDVKWRNPTLPGPDEAPIPDFVPAPVEPGPGDRNGAVYAMALATGDVETPYLPTTAYFEIKVDPEPVRIYSWRGWTAVEIERAGRWVRFFETHVEDQLQQLLTNDPPLPPWFFQAFQDAELLSILETSYAMAPMPTIAMGDFNVYRHEGDANPPTYAFLTGSPFPLPVPIDLTSILSDAWVAVHGDALGYTWGFSPDLRSGELTTTLDLVLATTGVRPIASYRVGTHDRTRSGLHPSDHAGIVTVFAIR
ncbi:MAG: endonuclease/exonuclease/phosphatase family protein [Anaeromyxobacteraceae bacterium]